MFTKLVRPIVNLNYGNVLRSISTATKPDPNGPPIDFRPDSKDRTKLVSYETSVRYMQSLAFKQTYGGELIWTLYRRNFKGQFLPKKTRERCIRGGLISTGSPCPICRDKYLVVHEDNLELLKQFISPTTGALIHYNKTHVCQKQYKRLVVAIKRAKERGYLPYEIPFRKYDYSLYYKNT